MAPLLLLADGRLPAGGHAHSGGMEAAVAAGLVTGGADLECYLAGRLATTGRVDAAVAVATWRHAGALPPPAPPAAPSSRPPADPPVGALPSPAPPLPPSGPPGGAPAAVLAAIDAEASARMASSAQRGASRAQGRGLLRVARRCWPAPALDVLGGLHRDGPLAPMALGGAGAVAGLDAVAVATASLWAALSGPAWAAVRLLGLDPLEVTAALARRSGDIDREAGRAAAQWGHSDRAPAELPAAGAPLVEIGAEAHAGWEVRLFAS